MQLRMPDTFTESLSRPMNNDQKVAKLSALDLQLNPSSSGLELHKLDKARDTYFWSVHVVEDIRVIVHRITGSLLLCYVDHHDKAYS